MQIYKTSLTPGKASETGLDAPESPLPETNAGEPLPPDSLLSEEAPIEVNLFEGDDLDLLFAGAGKNRASADQFSPATVVTLKEWLMENPEGRFYLDKFILKLESVRDKRFAVRLKNLKEAFKNGQMRPSEIVAVQEQIARLEKAVAKINAEIEKAKALQMEQKDIHFQEMALMRDLNGDRYVGDPNDKSRSYIVGTLPNGQEVLLDPVTKKPAVDPYLNPHYRPRFIDGMAAQAVAKEAAAPHDGTNYDFGFKITALREFLKGRYEHTPFGAQINVTVPEFIWVEAEKGKPVREGALRFKPVAMKMTEGGFWGQEPPAGRDRDGVTAVRVAKVEIHSEPVIEGGRELEGGFVFITFKDKDGTVIARLRFEGRQVGQKRVFATDAGVALNGGQNLNDPDSMRLRPVEIDASNLKSTASAAYNFMLEDLLEQIEPGEGTFEEKLGRFLEGGPGASKEETERRIGAILHTVINGFNDMTLHVEGQDSDFHNSNAATMHWLNRYPAGMTRTEIKRDIITELEKFPEDAETTSIIRDIRAGLDGNNYSGIEGRLHNTPRATKGNLYLLLAIRNVLKKKIPEFRAVSQMGHGEKLGIVLLGLRGVHVGTRYNDIAILPPPNAEEIRKMLPIGAAEITPDHPAYGTYFEGAGGKNIVVSQGGDLYAKDVTFLWRNPDKASERNDNLYVETTNNNAEILGGKQDAIFVHIGDTHPANVYINNGEDQTDDTAANAKQGIADDWYEGPSSMVFSHVQDADVPGGQDSVESGVAPDIRAVLDRMRGEVIGHDPLAVAENFDPGEWDFGPNFKKDDANEGAFFEDPFFNEEPEKRE